MSSTVTTIFWVYLLLSMIQLFLLPLGRADTSALYDINPAAAMPDDYFSPLEKKVFLTFCPTLNFFSFLPANEGDIGIGICGWLLTAFSWVIVIVTLPFSLCVCFKVMKIHSEKKVETPLFGLSGGPRVRKSCHLSPGSPFRRRLQGTR